MLKRNIPLRCRLVERVLVIEVGIDIIKHAAESHEEFWQPQTDKVALVVSDSEVFAKDVKSWLCEEAEDGSTPVSRLLDEAIEEAVNQGSEGVDYDAMEKIEKLRGAQSMDEQLYRKTTVNADQLMGTQYEGCMGDVGGWCKHCGWAAFAHFIRASDGALLCRKSSDSATADEGKS